MVSVELARMSCNFEEIVVTLRLVKERVAAKKRIEQVENYKEIGNPARIPHNHPSLPCQKKFFCCFGFYDETLKKEDRSQPANEL